MIGKDRNYLSFQSEEGLMKVLKDFGVQWLASLFLIFYVPCQALPTQQNFITHEFSGGRFGDNLLSYLHAKWLSHRYQIPMVYKPFLYSSELVLDDVELHYNLGNLWKYKTIYIREELDLNSINRDLSLKEAPRLYVCPYFPECSWERANLKSLDGGQWHFFPVDWKNPEFRSILKTLIAPKEKDKYFLTLPPRDKISIAIHFREGGGYDTGDWALYNLMKAPPLDFYIEGLSQVVKLFPDKALYCYLFTDALDPALVVNALKQSLPPEADVTFGCREVGNAHNKNVLDDFFSFFEFDVLIHPKSNFSLIPSLIHDYAVTYSPVFGKREGNQVVIHEVKFEIHEELYKRLME